MIAPKLKNSNVKISPFLKLRTVCILSGRDLRGKCFRWGKNVVKNSVDCSVLRHVHVCAAVNYLSDCMFTHDEPSASIMEKPFFFIASKLKKSA